MQDPHPLCMEPWCPFPAVLPANPNFLTGDGLAVAIVTVVGGQWWFFGMQERSPGICIALSKLENLHVDSLLVCF